MKRVKEPRITRLPQPNRRWPRGLGGIGQRAVVRLMRLRRVSFQANQKNLLGSQ